MERQPETGEVRRTGRRRRLRRGVLLVSALAFGLLLMPVPPALSADETPPSPRRVLLLHSYQPTMTWVARIERAVTDVLQPDENDILLYVEYMDTKHVSTPEYLEKLKEVYRIKYRHLQLDLVISADNHAFDFLRQERDELFPGAPVVFCGVNFFKDAQIAGLSDFTGVAETFDALSTAELILRFHPEAETLFIINDFLKTGRAWAETMREDLRPLADRVHIRHSENLPFDALLDQLRTFGPDTVILLGVYFGDTFGRYFTYEKIGEALSAASRVPVYCLLDFNIGHGAVGGKVINGYDQGRAAAEIGLRILNGEDADRIPVQKTGATRFIFDYRQLRAFDIPPAALPEPRTLLFKPVSFYERHQRVILWTLAIILVQTGVILLLLMNVRRRKRAERSLTLLNENLEARVRERTAEIVKINGDLQESEAKYRNLIERAGPGFMIIQEGRIQYVNSRFQEMIGFGTEELIGRPFYIVIRDDLREMVKDRYRRRMEGEPVPEIYEAALQDRDGRSIDVEVNANVLHYMGRPADFVYVHDITDRKRTERQLKEAKDAAEAGSRAKSEFLANMSHEIRTPMNAILGFSEILLDGAESPRQQRHLSQIHASGKALMSLVDDILDLSKIEAGRMEIHPAPADMRDILGDIVQVFSQKAAEKGLDLSVSIDETLPNALLLDEARIRQVLINLVGNAVKFTDKGGVTVSVHGEKRDGADGRMALTMAVADTGIGIPDDHKQVIFDSFHQQDGHTARQYGGAGLGLSITRRLARLMNGVISVQDRKGGGSVFRLVIPNVEIADDGAAADPETDPAADRTAFAPARIMIVDDTRSNREVIRTFIADQPMTAVEVESGEEALVRLAEGPRPDAILMDLRMPGMSGFKTADRIRKTPAFGAIPLIAMTAFTLKEVVEKTRDRFDGCLTKPMSRAALFGELRRFLPVLDGDGAGSPPTDGCPHPPGPMERADRVADPDGLRAAMEAEVLPEWRSLGEAFFMNDIQAFSQALAAVADRYGAARLTAYCRELDAQVAAHDIDGVERLLERFPALAASIGGGGQPDGEGR